MILPEMYYGALSGKCCAVGISSPRPGRRSVSSGEAAPQAEKCKGLRAEGVIRTALAAPFSPRTKQPAAN